MSVHLLEELSMAALDALDRARTLVVLTVSPLEQHGPHLPLGVDAYTARHFGRAIAERLVASRPGWSAVLAPTLHLGAFTFDGVGTVRSRPGLVREAVTDYGTALARAGFRWILVSNGHAGPTHLVALEEAAATVARRYGARMASLSGHLAWAFRVGRFLERVEERLGRPLTDAERRAFAEDAHGGWWETSMMLWLRPDLVDPGYRDLPPATYTVAERLRPDYPLREGGKGYVGHPALADPAFAHATSDVLLDEAMRLVDALIEGRLPPSARRSPFSAVPFFRSGFWPAVAGGALVLAALAWIRPRRTR